MKKRLEFKKNFMFDQGGFTLIEMMIVIVIISVLLLIAVPNLTKNKELANDKSCEATIELLRAQKIAYEMDKGVPLTNLQDLVTEKYVDRIICPDGKTIDIKSLDF